MTHADVNDGTVDGSAARRGVVRGTLVNFGGTAVALAVGFVTTPFFVDRLGAEAYGLYVLTLVFTMGGYFGYLELGLPASVIRFGGTAAAQGRWSEFSRITAAAASLLAFLGVFFAVGLGVLAFGAHRLFNLPRGLEDEFRLGLLVAAAILVVQLPALAVAAALQAIQRFDLVVLQRTAASVGGVVLALLLVLATDDLRAYVLPVLLMPVLGSVALLVLARRLIRQFTLRPRAGWRNDSRQLLRFGLAVFVAQAGIAVVAGFDQILIGITLTTRDLAIYGIAASLYYPVFALTSITNSTIFPATVHLAAGDDRERVGRLLERATRISGTIILCGAVIAAVWAEPFVRVWLDDSFAESGVLVAIWLVHMIATAFVGIGWSMFGALGRVLSAARISVFSALINVVASLALVGPFGLRGIVVGTALAYLVTAPLIVRVILQATGVGLRRFLRHAVAPALPPAAVTATGAILFRTVADPATLSTVVAWGAATVMLAGCAVYAALGGTERAAFVASLRRR